MDQVNSTQGQRGALVSGDCLLLAEEKVRVLQLHAGRNAAGQPVLNPLNTTLAELELLGYSGRAAQKADALGVLLNLVRCLHDV